MSVKINGKKLHLTTFEVPTSGRNIRACLVAQKEFAKADMAIRRVKDDDDESVVKSLDAQISLLDAQVAFLKQILKLSDAQVEKVEDADFNNVTEFVTEVISKVLQFDSSKSDSE